MTDESQIIDPSTLDKVLPSITKEVVHILAEANFEHWLDSGTLLAIVRDGQLLAHDNDIDISVFVESENNLEPLISALSLPGYRLDFWRMGGQIYKLKLKPDRTQASSMVVDIDFFRRQGESLFCPSSRLRELKKDMAEGRLLTNVIFAKLVRHLLWSPRWRPDMSSKILDTCLFRDCWLLPLSLVLPTRSLPDSKYCVPSQIAAYLEYRYGDWRTPRRDWVFHLHDGAYQREYF